MKNCCSYFRVWVIAQFKLCTYFIICKNNGNCFTFCSIKKLRIEKTCHIAKQSVQQMQKNKTKNDKLVLMYYRMIGHDAKVAWFQSKTLRLISFFVKFRTFSYQVLENVLIDIIVIYVIICKVNLLLTYRVWYKFRTGRNKLGHFFANS